MHSILISLSQRQICKRQTLSEQFKQYKNDCPRIRTIPVGSIESLQYPEKERKPYSIMTASRLANENMLIG